VLVVGSGASAVHFAQSALERGSRVTMLDVGRERPEPVRPDLPFAALKTELDDPCAYFLGPRYEAVLWPGASGEYYGVPAHKSYVFEGVPQFRLRARGFAPLSSFGQGGLAEAWTGAALPFTAPEVEDYPFPYEELAPYYGRVARRIGVSGAADDLAAFLPAHEHLGEALDLDEHSALLLARYQKKKRALNEDLGCWMGRSRVAVLRDDTPSRQGCTYLGRCLWGCPRDALYTPSITLREIRTHAGFRYVGGVYVSRLEIDGANRVRAAVAERLAGGASERHEADAVVLAAGTLSSSRIFLESLRQHGGSAPRLAGLMDNRQVLLPFVNLGMLRRVYDAESYQYHQLALGLTGPRPKEYVHGLVTTLKTALIHPIVQSLPLDLASALYVFKNAHAALGVVNVNWFDSRREENSLELEPAADGGPSRMLVSYSPASDEKQRIRATLRRVRGALWELGCFVPPGMMHVRPMGASVHYAGTLPMSAQRRPLTTSRDGASHDLENLWFADGTTLPFLPAKNLTFTLMANAMRIAERAF